MFRFYFLKVIPSSIFYKIAFLACSFLITVISLFLFRRKYLKINKILPESVKNAKYLLLLISGVIPFFVVNWWYGKKFEDGAIFLLAAILSMSCIFRSNGNYTYRSFKEKYLLALSLNLSSTLTFLAFNFIYSSIFRTKVNFSNWKDVVSSFFFNVPDLFVYTFLLFPLLLLFTIITSNFIKNNKDNPESFEEEVLDSNLFK